MKKRRWYWKLHTHASKVTYFGSSKANVPLQVNLNVFRDIPEQISMITTPPPIPSDEMNHLKKKKVTNCSIWKSESESINLNRLQRPCVILKQTTQHLDCPGGKNRAHYIPLASIYNVFNKTATIWGPKSYNTAFHLPGSQSVWSL